MREWRDSGGNKGRVGREVKRRKREKNKERVVIVTK